MTTKRTTARSKTADAPETEEVKAVQTAPEGEDVAALSPESDGTITLQSGSVVRVDKLRTRGMFKLMKMITRGAAPILLGGNPLDPNSEDFGPQLLAIVLIAIPEAEDAAIEFIQSMVTPEGFIEHPRNKAQEDSNQRLINDLIAELDDPDPIDTIAIIEAIITAESGNLAALGKRLGSVMKVQMASLGAKNSSSTN